LELKKLQGEPQVIVSPRLQQQIDFLHNKIGGIEWSGVLIYKIHQGDITDPENLVLRAEGLYLMHIGTSGGTRYETDEESAIELYDHYPELEKLEEGYRTGFIHTHHDMKIYFSGVDDSELEDNTQNYNIYLSLIVGFNLKYVARVAFVTNIETTTKKIFKYKNVRDEDIEYPDEKTETKKIIAYFDCDVAIEHSELDQSFIERYQVIEEEKSKPVYVQQHAAPYTGYGYGYGKNHVNHDKWAEKYGKKKEEPKPTGATISQLSRFCVKMITKNPANISGNINQALISTKYEYKGDYYDMLEVLDDCMESSVGTYTYKKMSITDKYTFMEDCIEMLKEGDLSKPALATEFKGARVLVKLLTEVVKMEINENSGF
jgi:hypothetical protein